MRLGANLLVGSKYRRRDNMKLSKITCRKLYAAALASTLALTLALGSLPTVHASALETDGTNNTGTAEETNEPANTDKQGSEDKQPTEADKDKQGEKPAEENAKPAENADGGANGVAVTDNNVAPAAEPVPAPAPAPAPEAEKKTLDKIDLPEYAGAIVHDYFVPQEAQGENGSYDTNKYAVPKQAMIDLVFNNEAVKKALSEANISKDDLTATASDEDVNDVYKKIYGDGRQGQLKDIRVTLKDKEGHEKTTKIKLFYYEPPFAHDKTSKGNKYSIGKVMFDDPNSQDAKLSDEQKTKLIARFLEVNAETGLTAADCQMDENGSLTITKDGCQMLIPGSEFVSVVGKVKDFYVFADPNATKDSKGKDWGYSIKSYDINPEMVINIRKGAYANVQYINNPRNNNNDGRTGSTFTNDSANGKLIISGKINAQGSRMNMMGARGVIRVTVNSGDPVWKRHLSNTFRIVGIYPETATIIRNVDEEAQHIDAKGDQLKSVLKAETKGIQYGGDGAFGNVDAKFENDPGLNKNNVNQEIAKDLQKSIDVSTLKHVAGAQIFDSTLSIHSYLGDSANAANRTTKSSTIPVKLIYYTAKVPKTFVANKTALTPEEKEKVKEAVKKANGWNETNNNFTVEIAENGDATITFNEKYNISHNGKATNSKKLEVKINNLVTTEKYEEKTASPGDKVTSKIKTTGAQDWTVPAGATFALPDGSTKGLTVNDKTGELTYAVPEDFAFPEGKDKVEVTGVVNVTTTENGKTVVTPVPYKFIVEKPGKATLKYVLDSDFNKSPSVITVIEEKFQKDADKKHYPSEITGKRNTKVKLTDLDKFNGKDKAPKFIGYEFVKVAAGAGALGNYDVNGTQVLYLTYNKLDDIIEAKDGQKAPDGYVTVTFKDVEGAKVGDKDENKVYYVNPKAGVKLTDDGKNLVGKKADGTELKVDVPAVTADEGHKLKYAEQDTDKKWSYDNFDKLGKTIEAPTEFTAQVKDTDAATYTPNYEQDKTTKPGVAVTIPTPSFTGKDGKKVDPTNLPQGIKYEKVGTTDGVKVDPTTGAVTVTPDKSAKIGDVITVKVKVKYPDNSEEEVSTKVTVTGDITTTKVFVKNLDSLTKEEQDAVKKNVKDNNPNLPTDATITVDDKGNVTITDKSGKELAKLTPNQTVFTVKAPALTLVDDTNKLTPDEQGLVKTAIAEANKKDGASTLPDGTTVEVDEKGNAILKDKTGKEITSFAPKDTVYSVKQPEITIVGNKDKLTEKEKEQVEKKIKEKNPDLPTDLMISVADDGTLTFKRGDKVVKTIKGNKVVTEVTPGLVVVPSPSRDEEIIDLTPNRSLTTRKPYVVTKTGELASSMSILGALVILLGGAIVSKRKH